jgi:hypothetical protein
MTGEGQRIANTMQALDVLLLVGSIWAVSRWPERSISRIGIVKSEPLDRKLTVLRSDET